MCDCVILGFFIDAPLIYPALLDIFRHQNTVYSSYIGPILALVDLNDTFFLSVLDYVIYIIIIHVPLNSTAQKDQFMKKKIMTLALIDLILTPDSIKLSLMLKLETLRRQWSRLHFKEAIRCFDFPKI